MAFVLDNSVAMAWCFPDEATAFTEAMLDDLRETESFVPSIWPLEVANVLLVAERRQRITTAQASAFAEQLGILPITVEAVSLDDALGPILTTARAQQLSSYDASYLALAMREGLPSRRKTRECGRRPCTWGLYSSGKPPTP